MQDNKRNEQNTKSICGAFDEHFNRKFRGRTVRSVSVDRLKLSKVPQGALNRQTRSGTKSQNMLPKLKEIEKIAKTQRKKGPKLNKYLDGISDLDLYIANKQLTNLTTQQLVTQLSIRQRRGTEHLQAINMFYAHGTTTHQKFHETNLQTNQTNQTKNMSKTDYVRRGKWVSDQQLVQRFDQFIVHKHEEQSAHDMPKTKTRLSREQMAEKISADKEQLTVIAKKMIADQNRYTEQDQIEIGKKMSLKNTDIGQHQLQSKSIEWILNQCDSYNKKFHIKRGLSKIG